MGYNILLTFIFGSIVVLLFIIPLILIERNVIKTSKVMKSFFEDELKLSFHVPYKNSKDGSIIIFSRSNGLQMVVLLKHLNIYHVSQVN